MQELITGTDLEASRQLHLSSAFLAINVAILTLFHQKICNC